MASARGTVVRDADGASLRFVGASLDITHLKQVEEERCLATEQLRESEQRWRSLAETLPHLVWTADCKGTIDYLSAQATAYTGLTESDAERRLGRRRSSGRPGVYEPIVG